MVNSSSWREGAGDLFLDLGVEEMVVVVVVVGDFVVDILAVVANAAS